MKRFLIIFVLGGLLWGGCKKENTTPTITGINGSVNAFAIYNGNLIAAGSFTKAANVPVNNIAQCNGTAWSNLGGGLTSVVTALATYNGKLIAGCPNLGIYQWNGSSWTQLSSGYSSFFLFSIYDNNLIVAGTFNSIGGVNAKGLAQWNGIKWAQVDSNAYSGITSIDTFKGNLIIAGGNLSIGNNTHCGVSQRNGSSWTTIYNPPPYAYPALVSPVLYNNKGVLYLGDYLLLATFTSDSTGNINILGGVYNNTSVEIYNFCSYNSKVITFLSSYFLENETGGYYIQQCIGDTLVNLTGTPNINAMIQYQSNLIIGGNFSTVGNTQVMNIAQWNNSTWSPL